jgi:uncharacterized glyoxalase superfamily protein PhnB
MWRHPSAGKTARVFNLPPTGEQERKNMAIDLVTYLSFDGQSEAAFKHYEKVLGGKILMMARYADAPTDAGVPRTPETDTRIMHVRLQVGDRFLMGGATRRHGLPRSHRASA